MPLWLYYVSAAAATIKSHRNCDFLRADLKRLLNILRKSDGEYHIEEHATELQEVHPLTTDSNRLHLTRQLSPPTYQDCTLDSSKDGTSV